MFRIPGPVLDILFLIFNPYFGILFALFVKTSAKYRKTRVFLIDSIDVLLEIFRKYYV